MPNDPYATRHIEQRRIRDADQAEMAAIRLGSATADTGFYDDRVAEAMDDYDPHLPDDAERWHEADMTLDSGVGGINEETQRRSELLGSSYPFEVSNGRLLYTPSRSMFYEFCLAISLADELTTGEYTLLPRSFERICAILVNAYMGSYSSCLHVGSPRDEDVGATFYAAMQRLHRDTREWFWGPDPDLPQQPSTTGDEGVDFIVWKAPTDGRLGSLFVIGQCACGDNWKEKFFDADLAKYCKWFNPGSFVTPVRAFATPHHVGDGFLHEALRNAGLLFDRARLTLLAEELATDATYLSWSDNIGTCTRLVIPSAGSMIT